MEIKKYNFKKQIEELKIKRGRGTELVSLYIPYGTQIHEVSNHLRDEYSQASNIKSRVTRLNVQSILQSLLSRLKLVQIPENGIVIFCGAVDIGANKTEIQTYIVEPIEQIKTYKYYCDSSFLLEPLENMVPDKKLYGLIVLDLNEATIGTLRGNHIEVIDYIVSMVPNKHKKGGQSSHRFQELRKIAINEFFKKLGNTVNNAFMNQNLDGIFIGGHSPTKQEFNDGEYMNYQLRDKILGLYDVGYTNEFGLRELVSKLGDDIKNIETMNEKKFMDRFLSQIIRSDRIAPYGDLDLIKKNLEIGSIDTLLLSDKLDKNIVNELTELAQHTNANILFISDDFEEGKQLWNTFGGVATILRY